MSFFAFSCSVPYSSSLGRIRLGFWCPVSETASLRRAWFFCILTSFSIWSPSALAQSLSCKQLILVSSSFCFNCIALFPFLHCQISSNCFSTSFLYHLWSCTETSLRAETVSVLFSSVPTAPTRSLDIATQDSCGINIYWQMLQ